MSCHVTRILLFYQDTFSSHAFIFHIFSCVSKDFNHICLPKGGGKFKMDLQPIFLLITRWFAADVFANHSNRHAFCSRLKSKSGFFSNTCKTLESSSSYEKWFFEWVELSIIINNNINLFSSWKKKVWWTKYVMYEPHAYIWCLGVVLLTLSDTSLCNSLAGWVFCI